MTFLCTHWRWRLSVLCIFIIVDVWQSNIFRVVKHKILSLNLSKTRGRNRWFMKFRSNQGSHFYKCCWHWQHDPNWNLCTLFVKRFDGRQKYRHIFFYPQIMMKNIVMIVFIRSLITVQRSNDCLKIARKWAPNNLHPFQTMILTEIKYHLWKHLLFLVT